MIYWRSCESSAYRAAALFLCPFSPPRHVARQRDLLPCESSARPPPPRRANRAFCGRPPRADRAKCRVSPHLPQIARRDAPPWPQCSGSRRRRLLGKEGVGSRACSSFPVAGGLGLLKVDLSTLLVTPVGSALPALSWALVGHVALWRSERLRVPARTYQIHRPTSGGWQ